MSNSRTAVCKEKIYCFGWIIAPLPGTGKRKIANVIVAKPLTYVYNIGWIEVSDIVILFEMESQKILHSDRIYCTYPKGGNR